MQDDSTYAVIIQTGANIKITQYIYRISNTNGRAISIYNDNIDANGLSIVIVTGTTYLIINKLNQTGGTAELSIQSAADVSIIVYDVVPAAAVNYYILQGAGNTT